MDAFNKDEKTANDAKRYKLEENMPEKYEKAPPTVTTVQQCDQEQSKNMEKANVSSSPKACNILAPVIASHYNELNRTGREERSTSRIFHMRCFNNWIKAQLIIEYTEKVKQRQRQGEPINVLDMCCGKGGDLLKWERVFINHLICTDIAEISLEQCKQRYAEKLLRWSKSTFLKRFSAEFIICDSTLVSLSERYTDPMIKLNLVSCQFAFHYSFESLLQADCMVRNAAESLQQDGYFIATIPDANEIMRRLRQSTDGRSFGNAIYNIEFQGETNPPPLFGAKYMFHLDGAVNCPEFLVHFPTLVKLCRLHGLKLERKTTFADYYKDNLGNGYKLLERTKGLKMFHSNEIDAIANNEQYAHVKNFFKGSNAFKPIGTLEKCLWEAITLYTVCAFKKCKTIYDAEGKPAYDFTD